MAAHTADAARQWFDREFIALECDVPSPIGKVLIAYDPEIPYLRLIPDEAERRHKGCG